ncbi:MAG: GNAT family N-acetyltransferase, partial [Hungatella hathewayi]|nr:GNAT family N-acetyltransferase [Hungatella hathewayi]
MMCKLLLVKPSKQYAEQVMSYKEEMLENGDSFDGCAGLEDVHSFGEWIDFETRLKAKYKDGYVPSEVFLAIRQRDNHIVGMIDFRHPLSDFLFNFGGNIGYSVRPSERQKGYATEMLRLILPICRKFG